MIYLIFLKRQIVIFRMNTQEFVEEWMKIQELQGIKEKKKTECLREFMSMLRDFRYVIKKKNKEFWGK